MMTRDRDYIREGHSVRHLTRWSQSREVLRQPFAAFTDGTDDREYALEIALEYLAEDSAVVSVGIPSVVPHAVSDDDREQADDNLIEPDVVARWAAGDWLIPYVYDSEPADPDETDRDTGTS